ncbi:MAG: HrcA family transcriptional regulator, partial [Lachnospiraceae bacterium]|nr:HrcA family transcriptional regulator [Lachnospiraceae bacterium]
MELTERKAKIIEAIIKNYQKTGEPVGSRTISKDTDLNVSSATIRNEMADLEEMGLIMSPHTSAGRVPTDLAYRMYVEKLMSPEELEMIPQPEKNELVTQDFLLKRVDRVELMLEQLVKVVAANTN